MPAPNQPIQADACTSAALTEITPEKEPVQPSSPVRVSIYVQQFCQICLYAYQVADTIRADFPQISLQVVDIGDPQAEIPEIVFATPTYLLNDYLWSLGNPAPEEVNERLHQALSVPHNSISA